MCQYKTLKAAVFYQSKYAEKFETMSGAGKASIQASERQVLFLQLRYHDHRTQFVACFELAEHQSPTTKYVLPTTIGTESTPGPYARV